MKHLLVTNDFPPKVGGIQTYLWELWRRLPSDDVVVLTTPFDGAQEFDAGEPYVIERWDHPVLWPTPALARRVERLAHQHDVELVLFDPVVPVGALALRTARPYGVVVHGAELVIPANIPGGQLLQRSVLRGAQVVIAAGGYPATEARRAAGRPVDTVLVPPGVDTTRFVPLADRRAEVRARWGIEPDAPVIVSVSRLVRRKGYDVLIEAAAQLANRFDGLQLVLAGDGRDRPRLEALAAERKAPVRFLGAVDHEELPGVHAMGDVFAMLCHDRWGGLEREGFGIVFLEAAACGVPQVAGRSGGSAEAVVDGETGLVLDEPRSIAEVVGAIGGLLGDADRRRAMGAASRTRAEESYTYDHLAGVLRDGLEALRR